MTASRRCLVVDDEKAMRLLIRLQLEAAGGYLVTTCATVADAVSLIVDVPAPFDLVVSDNRIDGRACGLDVLAAARRRDDDTTLILLTAQVDSRTAVQAQDLGARVVDKAELDSICDLDHIAPMS